MGKMKEVFMAMREDEWDGSEEEYLEYYVNTNGLYVEKEKLEDDTNTIEEHNKENNDSELIF